MTSDVVNCTADVSEMTTGEETTTLHGWRLTETDEEGMAFCTVQPPQLVHVIVVIVAGLSIGQRGVGSVDGLDQLAESDPLVETEGGESPKGAE